MVIPFGYSFGNGVAATPIRNAAPRWLRNKLASHEHYETVISPE